MATKKKRKYQTNDDLDRLTVLVPTDSKRLLARIAFETDTAMADMVRHLLDDYLIGMADGLPVGVKLPRRLESLRIERAK